jgi:chromosome segregation ATPase
MQGLFETLAEAIFARALSPSLLPVLMAVAPKKGARAELKKIYVLDDAGDMAGEYVLDADCPIDYNDFLRALPDDGIGDRESLFVGEYVFTAFQSGRSVFVLLSRGQLSAEDFNWTSLVLNAAHAHAAKTGRAGKPEPAPSADAERALTEREGRLAARESELAQIEARLQADQANVRGRHEELERQKARLSALADYVTQMQQGFAQGVWRANQSGETWKALSAELKAKGRPDDARALADARGAFDAERRSLADAKASLEAKLRDAGERIQALEAAHKDAITALERERTETKQRDAESEKVREQIEARVADLSQRFAAMAKERLVASHKPTAEPSDAAKQAIELEKGQLAKERKFLQKRAIEILDQAEQTQVRQGKLDEREAALQRIEEELAARQEELKKARPAAAPAGPPGPPKPDVEEARKDIDRRVKIIQQKALELLDREEKLAKRAAELKALEDRLSGKVAAK